MASLRKFWVCDGGATAIEYALVATLISIALISGFTTFSGAMNDKFNYLSDKALGDGQLGK